MSVYTYFFFFVLGSAVVVNAAPWRNRNWFQKGILVFWGIVFAISAVGLIVKLVQG